MDIKRRACDIRHRITGFSFTFSIIRYSRKIEDTTFQELDLFQSSGKGVKTPSQLGLFEIANLNHRTTSVRFTQLFNHFKPG
jgi:hypothetical protein